MKIAIVGAGAMGGPFGACLALARQDVSFVEALETTTEVISRQDLRLETPDAQESAWVPISRAYQVTGHSGLLVIFTRGFHTAATIGLVRHLVGPQTQAFSMQNGLGNAELITRVVPAKRIIVDVTNLSADLVAPGVVHSHGEGHINIWAGNGKDGPTVHEIAADFSQAGLPYEADPQVQVSIQGEVAFDATLSSVCAVTRRTAGMTGHAEGERQVASRIVSEAVAVAQAAGVDADQRWVIAAADYAFRHHQQHKPSMLWDVEAGRKIEVDFINGAVVERGKRLGVTTPVPEMLSSLVGLSRGQISQY